MPRVVLPKSVGDQFAGGATEIEVEGETVRALVRGLDSRFPGIADTIAEGMAIAVDGEIIQNAMLEPVRPDSEVYLLPKIGGGGWR